MFGRLFTALAGLTVLSVVQHGSLEDNSQAGVQGERVPVGHLKPFGAHRPSEGTIDQVQGFLDPVEFYKKYVKESKPVLFKQAATGIPAFQLWTDKHLSDKYGDLLVDVEEGKKENRSQGVLSMPLKRFIASYSVNNIYMVQDVMEDMKAELSLPKCLWCGGFQDTLELGVIWFSSGGTRSVLHYDSVDNINCLVDGDKSIKFVDKKHSKRVETYGFVQAGTYSDIDVEAVDLLQYPTFEHVPWWSGKMQKGDCLYIPQKWYHTVESSETRNLAVNLWFVHLLWFNQTDCDVRTKHVSPIPKYDSLEKYQFHMYNKMGGSLEKIRSDVFEPFEGLPEITLEVAIKEWGEYGDEADVQVLFEMIDEDKDMSLSWEEIYKSDILTLIMNFPYMLSDITPEEMESLQQESPDTAEPYDDFRDEL